jgi:hypothetical protein
MARRFLLIVIVILLGLPIRAQTKQASTLTSVTISSIPTGADIYLDKNFVGNAPSTIKVASGKHSVAVKKKDFRIGSARLRSPVAMSH